MKRLWSAVVATLLLAASGSAQTPAAGPTVEVLHLPPFPGAHAIWGATGRDGRGHIWFGSAAANIPNLSAHLFEYDPTARTFTDHGGVVEALKRAAIARPGEQQAKIHSKIVPGPDGCLYFASMDEDGEHDDGTKLPTWGGHLWRLRLATSRWEHLRSTPEALIAVASGDRFIFALGYFGQVVYRYDTKTGDMKRLEVGTVDGHVSRNFFADYRGHVYVTRLRAEPSAPGASRVIHVSLVELDSNLQQVGETPIDTDHYIDKEGPTESHGIIAIQEMGDKSWYFTTHRGYLYHVVVPLAATDTAPSPAAIVDGLGWMHPQGPAYVPSLFTPDGSKTLFAVATDNYIGGWHHEWLTCQLSRFSCVAADLNAPEIKDFGHSAVYGSATRDADGGYYVVGTTPDWNGVPIVLRVVPASAGR